MHAKPCTLAHLRDVLTDMRTRKWESAITNDYHYARGICAGALIAGVIDLTERDRMCALIKNVRQHALEDLKCA